MDLRTAVGAGYKGDTVTAMAQKEVEVILMRQLASYLATPVFLVDPEGTLIFYNEAAEAVLGRRFEDTGEMSATEWAAAFQPTDDAGRLLPRESLPLVVSLREGRPAAGSLWIRALDQVPRNIEVTAFPLVGQGGRRLGAAAIFFEVGQP